MIKRFIERSVRKDLFKKKVILIFGPRQVGKTTLIENLAKELNVPFIFLNGDDSLVREQLTGATAAFLKNMIGKNKVVLIDEAQRITNIGLTLKIMCDNMKEVQVIATGSSAFELANKINEPLTGRKYEHFLHPFSFSEMTAFHGQQQEVRLLEQRMIYGYYPEVVNNPGEEKRLLTALSDSYLYKDIFSYEKMKKPALLQLLLKALALQLGNEVSFNELGQIIGADRATVERYIDLLEKAFVVFRLPAFSGNVRNELKKSRKIYFYDNGIRNAIIGNYSPLGLRNDTGALWENFLISERLKGLHYNNFYGHTYFWRTTQQQEVDYIEEVDGKLFAFEFTWGKAAKKNIPKTFTNAYQKAKCQIINRDNFIDFVKYD